MSSHSESESNVLEGQTYQLGLFSTRCKNQCVATYTGPAKAKMELVLCTYYPRLKGLFPGEPDQDILVLSKWEAGKVVELKEINVSELELSELKSVKLSGKVDKRPSKGNGKRGCVDEDYREPTREEILMDIDEGVEILREYSASLDLVFVRNGSEILLTALVINNIEILASPQDSAVPPSE